MYLIEVVLLLLLAVLLSVLLPSAPHPLSPTRTRTRTAQLCMVALHAGWPVTTTTATITTTAATVPNALDVTAVRGGWC